MGVHFLLLFGGFELVLSIYLVGLAVWEEGEEVGGEERRKGGCS